MPPHRNFSCTLPRNFAFHYTDNQLPRTPEPEVSRHHELVEPPRLPRARLTVRRRRKALPSRDINAGSQDIPIPTIETHYALSSLASSPEMPAQSDPVEGLLQPAPIASRFFTPPRTPVAQTSTAHETAHFNQWDEMSSVGESISRPTSACSTFSDSSAFSVQSYGESCTSPESECADPFVWNAKQSIRLSPLTMDGREGHSAKRQRRNPKVSFTTQMDHHLWFTYMQYLQNATVTPFKMLPGVPPPQGVCTRVAREARKTWRGPRDGLRQQRQRSRFGSPDTVKAAGSGSSTPTVTDARKPYPSWPRENAATRKRLRELCKKKPSLSAHYQRLLSCRSPSPQTSSPRPRSSSASQNLVSAMTDASSSFSTRDMNVSLVTSTANAMNPTNPLAQLAREDNLNPSEDVFMASTPNRLSAHQKSQSLNLRTDRASRFLFPTQPTLGSPFHEQAHHTLGSRSLSKAAATGRLEPAVELHAPNPLPRSWKRRAQYNLDEEIAAARVESRENLLQELFGTPAETSHRRVRSRGFSLGDTSEGARRLSSLFCPPELSMSIPEEQSTIHVQALPAPSAIRLGSPFGGRSSNGNNTFPRKFGQQIFEPAASFEERLSNHMS